MTHDVIYSGIVLIEKLAFLNNICKGLLYPQLS